MNLICCGNSIASGYSFEEIKPLIYRIEDFEEIMKINGIDASYKLTIFLNVLSKLKHFCALINKAVLNVKIIY